tara:strand:+ start:3735 stop:3875 length:141 start_codon:yes stop_codon:yes gene_type:complete
MEVSQIDYACIPLIKEEHFSGGEYFFWIRFISFTLRGFNSQVQQVG